MQDLLEMQERRENVRHQENKDVVVLQASQELLDLQDLLGPKDREGLLYVS